MTHLRLRVTLLLPYIDEPFVWAKLHDENDGQENVYFKSQTPYKYTEAKEYCNRQGDLKSTQGDLKSTGEGTHVSQLWNFNSTTKTLKNKIWTSVPNVTWDIIPKANNKVSIQNKLKGTPILKLAIVKRSF